MAAWSGWCNARGDRLPPRALTGLYVGASGEIALGVGVGANALVGGSDKSIVLQPLSLEASVGVNLALGVAGLRLAMTGGDRNLQTSLH